MLCLSLFDLDLRGNVKNIFFVLTGSGWDFDESALERLLFNLA